MAVLGNSNIQIPYGTTCKYKITITGTSPDDLTSAFDWADWQDIVHTFTFNGQPQTIGVQVLTASTILCTVDESIYVDQAVGNFSNVSIPSLPARLTAVAKSDGKRYTLAQYSIQLSPKS